MDTRAVPVPVCMRTAKTELVDYMGTVIHAFQAYNGQGVRAVLYPLATADETCLRSQDIVVQIEEPVRHI